MIRANAIRARALVGFAPRRGCSESSLFEARWIAHTIETDFPVETPGLLADLSIRLRAFE